jgi:hypothetical protein
MDKKRIQVYADEEMKRRIELAAAKYDMPVTEYCLNAIEQQLAEDDLLEEQQVTISVNATLDKDFIDGLQALQEKIKRRRSGQRIDIDHIMSAMRAERDDELLGMR